MAQPLSLTLAAHLAGEVTTLATCWRIVRRDGVMLGFTTHDRDLIVGQQFYRAAASFTPSAVVGGAGLAVDNLEVAGAISSDALSARDLAEGRFDFARIEIFEVDWIAPDAGQLTLRSGFLGEIKIEDQGFRAELRGAKQVLQQPIGEVYSPECRADLGDRRCRVAVRDFTVEAAITAVSAPSVFVAAGLSQSVDWFRYGRLRFLSGANAGLDFEVKRSSAGQLTLFTPPPRPLAIGDGFAVEAGCDKRFTTCRDKFANAVNFRGEPFIPGIDDLLDYPGLA